MLQAFRVLQHLICRATTSIAIAKAGKHVFCDIFILKPLPGTHYLRSILRPVICRSEIHATMRTVIVSG